MRKPCPFLFVYGTLRKDGPQEIHQILAPMSTYLGKAWTHGRLYDLGEYPGLVPAKSSDGRVSGEVYRLQDVEKTLTLLDTYEGCGPNDQPPFEFARQLQDVTLMDGQVIEAWVYTYLLPVDENASIRSGNYSSKRSKRLTKAEPPAMQQRGKR